jgi:hypothetical protein
MEFQLKGLSSRINRLGGKKKGYTQHGTYETLLFADPPPKSRNHKGWMQYYYYKTCSSQPHNLPWTVLVKFQNKSSERHKRAVQNYYASAPNVLKTEILIY